MRNINRLLVLAPHTDDAELGCGGFMARLAEENADITVAAFSIAKESLPDGFAADTLEAEFRKSMSVFGIPERRQHLYDYPVRHFPDSRQEILEDLIRIRTDVGPELVLLPAATDVHQDHRVIHEEGVRAFRHQTVLGYEMPWNQIEFSSNAIVQLEERHLDTKWAALQCYESQLVKKSPYFNRKFAESLARVRGSQIKATYAEAYQVIRVRW